MSLRKWAAHGTEKVEASFGGASCRRDGCGRYVRSILAAGAEQGSSTCEPNQTPGGNTTNKITTVPEGHYWKTWVGTMAFGGAA